MDGWSPAAGVLVLLEPTTSGRADGLCLTGTVARTAPGPDAGLIIDLGGSPELPRSPCEVAASFYAPDGFYRVEARAEELGDGEIVVSFAVEPDRLAERARTVLPVSVAAFDGQGFLPSQGETLDLSGSGCRVQVEDRLPAGAAVAVGLGTGAGPLVIAATPRQEVQRGKGWEYRLAFEHVDDELRRRIDRLARRSGTA
jgi:hypothetical protein